MIGQSMGNYTALAIDIIRRIHHPTRSFPKILCIAPRRCSQGFVATLVDLIRPYVASEDATEEKVASILEHGKSIRFFPKP